MLIRDCWPNKALSIKIYPHSIKISNNKEDNKNMRA